MSGLETTGAHAAPNTCPFQCQSLAECRRRPECEDDQRRSLVIEGIRQFGLAPDGSDLRDLETQITRLTARVAELEDERTFPLGTRVTKIRGSSWTGHVVGYYSTSLNPDGICVESENEPGSVQVYPAAALRALAEAGEEG